MALAHHAKSLSAIRAALAPHLPCAGAGHDSRECLGAIVSIVSNGKILCIFQASGMLVSQVLGAEAKGLRRRGREDPVFDRFAVPCSEKQSDVPENENRNVTASELDYDMVRATDFR